MRIITHEDNCIGSGNCVLSAPELFDQRDEDGVVIVVDAEPGEAWHGAARTAESACPARAIEVRE
ncbi:ferredoxin [Gordonia crocea]|uniref:Ferredoxin n=1 Tax=Gordonia crocea TaxID=589162 RepID=A0A7M3SUB9_9ACTN|nr:ferredoxin [Gordonia crocea]GED96243.1 ferredoxin [Gordonia crocea]